MCDVGTTYVVQHYVMFVSLLAALSTPVAVTFDEELGLCFFTDVDRDHIYVMDLNTRQASPYVYLGKYSS